MGKWKHVKKTSGAAENNLQAIAYWLRFKQSYKRSLLTDEPNGSNDCPFFLTKNSETPDLNSDANPGRGKNDGAETVAKQCVEMRGGRGGVRVSINRGERRMKLRSKQTRNGLKLRGVEARSPANCLPYFSGHLNDVCKVLARCRVGPALGTPVDGRPAHGTSGLGSSLAGNPVHGNLVDGKAAPGSAPEARPLPCIPVRTYSGLGMPVIGLPVSGLSGLGVSVSGDSDFGTAPCWPPERITPVRGRADLVPCGSALSVLDLSDSDLGDGCPVNTVSGDPVLGDSVPGHTGLGNTSAGPVVRSDPDMGISVDTLRGMVYQDALTGLCVSVAAPHGLNERNSLDDRIRPRLAAPRGRVAACRPDLFPGRLSSGHRHADRGDADQGDTGVGPARIRVTGVAATEYWDSGVGIRQTGAYTDAVTVTNLGTSLGSSAGTVPAIGAGIGAELVEAQLIARQTHDFRVPRALTGRDGVSYTAGLVMRVGSPALSPELACTGRVKASRLTSKGIGHQYGGQVM